MNNILDELKADSERAECLVNILIGRATDGSWDESSYFVLRRHFLDDEVFSDLLPSWFRPQLSLDHFWQYIKNEFGTYKERRQFLWDEFDPLLSHCKSGEQFPAEPDISEGLASFDSASINRAWSRTTRRQNGDPEGAITASRTLLESVCKHILDDFGVEYDAAKIDLPQLYKLVAKQLNLSPDQHHEILSSRFSAGVPL